MQNAQGFIQFPPVIEFNCTTEPLTLDFAEAKTYTPGNLSNLFADVELLNNASLWHMIIVNHNGKLAKHEILRALNDLVGQEFFVPIAYRSVNASIDIFFLQNQTKALEKFFTSHLLVNDGTKQFSLSVKLGISKWRNRHPKVVNKIHAAVENRIQTMDKVNNVLDFNCFGSSLVLADFEVSLRNKSCFNILMDQLSNQERLKRRELKTNFSGNEINNLEPFTKLHDYKIKSIDLRNNDIVDVQHFHYLKHLNIESIELDGNEKLLRVPNHTERIFSIMPSLKTLDRKCNTKNIQIQTQGTAQSVKPPVPFDLGLGNENIGAVSSTSITISYQANRKEQFSSFGHLRDSFNSYRDEATWTKVVIHATDLSKDEILDALLFQVIDDCVFFPCYYQCFPNHHEFLVYRNFDALKCMMHKDLEFNIGNRTKVRIELVLKVATYAPGQVNWVHKIRSVLTKRIEGTSLNLNNFVNDPNFSKLSILLNSECNMNFVLEQAKKICPNLTTISAQNILLRNMKGFKNLNQQFPLLCKLDLTDNQIVSLDELVAPISKVKDISFDSNPICSKFQIAHAYVAHAQKYFTDVEILDGSKIDALTRVPSLQNFIISNKAYNLVDEFVRTFFGIYDTERHRLKELYTTNSLFSISVYYDPTVLENKSNLSSIFSRVQAYLNHSRFLQKIANMNQVFHNIFAGQESITDVMNRLPRTKHSIRSFNVDVPFYNPESVTIIKISGVFEDYGKTLTDKSNLFLGFSRNFVLRVVDNEVQISNDQLFINNTKLIDFAGNYISEAEHEISIDESEDKQVKMILFRELTNLKQEEALKLMEKTFYNFKMALGIFKTLMESNSYSESAFEFEN